MYSENLDAKSDRQLAICENDDVVLEMGPRGHQFVLEVVSLSPEEFFLFSDLGQKMKVLIEVIPYLLQSSLDFFSPLRNMNLGYTFLW